MLTAIDGATPILSRAQKRRLWCYESARYSSLGHSDNAKPGAKMLAHIFKDLRPRVQNQVVAACGPKYYWGQYGISPNDSVSAIVRALRVIRPEQRTQVISWLDSIPDVHTRHVIVAKGLRHADCLPEAAVEKLLTHIEGEQNRWETERNLEALEKHAHRLPDRFAARVVGLILAAHAQSEDRKPGFCKNATVAQCHELTIEAQSASDRGDHFEAARILSALTQRPFRPDRLVMQNEQSEIAAAISALPESMRVVIENKGFSIPYLRSSRPNDRHLCGDY